uniref:UPAR/Ly6 domain-containing protein n=1 Tax=Macrostomum lignano TaxID=282301 RepID=A0A1I8FLE7_9PLAT
EPPGQEAAADAGSEGLAVSQRAASVVVVVELFVLASDKELRICAERPLGVGGNAAVLPSRGTGFPMMSQISLTCLSASAVLLIIALDSRMWPLPGTPLRPVVPVGCWPLDAVGTAAIPAALPLIDDGIWWINACDGGPGSSCAVSIRCYVYSSILGDIGTEVNLPSGVTSCFKQDMTVLGVRIHMLAECNTDLCNSGHVSVVASASVGSCVWLPMLTWASSR